MNGGYTQGYAQSHRDTSNHNRPHSHSSRSPTHTPTRLQPGAWLDTLRRLHRRGYSDSQIQRWFEDEQDTILTRRQVYYWRAVYCNLPSNGQQPRFDGNGIKTRREQNEMVCRMAVSKLGWGHLLPDVAEFVETATVAVATAPLAHVETDSNSGAPTPTPVPPAPVVPTPFTLRPVEAVILSLLEENQRMTRRQIIDALCRHRSRKPLRSGSISYLPRLVRAGLVVEHRAVWNKRSTKAYSLAENLSTRTRTRRDDGIDMMIKAMTRK